MHLPLTRPGALALGVLTIAACKDTPTEPETPKASPTVAELAMATASDTWTRKADMFGTTRTELTTAAVTNSSGQSILYAIGGRTDAGSISRVQAYNVSTDSWTYKAPLPTPLFNTNGAAVIGGKIFVSGGQERLDKDSRPYLYMYDPGTNAWTRRRDMPEFTYGGITGVINDQLYVLTCGQPQEDCYRMEPPLELYRYDPATDVWTFVAFSPFGSDEPMGAAINGKLYFASDRSTRFTEYDPATNSWTSKASLPKERRGGSAVALWSRLYLIGGYERQADGTFQAVRTVRVYNPYTDSWSTRAPLPELRSGFSASRVFLNGKPRIEVVGGPRPGNNLQYEP